MHQFMHQATACSPNGILVRSGMINTMRVLQQRSGMYLQGMYLQGMYLQGMCLQGLCLQGLCLQEGSRSPRSRFGGA